MLGQLISAGITVGLVLGGVDAASLLEDLGGELLVGADRAVGGSCGELRTVYGDHANVDQAGLSAETEHLPEEVTERLLMADAKAGDCGVVGGLIGADHSKGDVLAAAALDSP